jgi:hypothetical protein
MQLPSELRDRIDEFLSPDSLLPPSLLAISRLLRRPALDLLLLHDDDAPPACCQRYHWSHPDFVYRGPAWVVRVTRQELRKPRSPEYTGVRISSLVPGISTVYTRVYSRLRGRACAWEIEGLSKVSLLLPVTDADAAYLRAWYKTHGCAWPRAKGGVHPTFLSLVRKHDEWVHDVWFETLPF